MKREYRLRGEKIFGVLFRRGRRVHTPFFSFLLRANQLHHARIACIISKKTEKSSVMRNRMRRRIMEWIRTRSDIASLPIDLAISVKKEAVGRTRKEFYEELTKGIEKITRG